VRGVRIGGRAGRLDRQVDAAYLSRWIGKISSSQLAAIAGSRRRTKGDRGNTLTRAKVESKVLRLARYRSGAGDAQTRVA
jgi:hypothetical protein